MTLEKNFIIKGRRAARLAAVQALYQLECEPVPPEQVIAEFTTCRFQEIVEGTRFINPDTVLFQDIVCGVTERFTTLDSMLVSTLSEGWRLDRMQSVVRAILRAAVFELLRNASVPTPVVINEYIEIAQAFCAEPEVSFVNAVLDKLAKLLRTPDLQE